MPHINYRRGETRRLVFRLEHGTSTARWHRFYKRKRDSHKAYKRWVNRLHRHQDKHLLRFDFEDPFPLRRGIWRLGSIVT